MKYLKYYLPFIMFIAMKMPIASHATGLIPENIVSMPGNGSTVLLVEKSTQTLFVYSYNGIFEEKLKVKCSTGKLKGRKLVAGDQKTPEGVYFITGKYLEKDLSPVYGVMAFPVDYPNLLDRESGRTGYAIWLHGTDRELKPRDSNGCVALENDNMKRVEKWISLDFTPVIFVKKIKYTTPENNADVRKEVYNLLKKWVYYIEKGSYHQYLSLYNSDYAPDIRWWNRWRKARKTKDGKLSAVLNNTGIYRDGDHYVVLFEEILKSGGFEKRIGIKKIYLSGGLKGKGEPLSIQGENYKYIRFTEKTPDKDRDPAPIIAAADDIRKRLRDNSDKELKKDIANKIHRWAKVWSKGDIASYSGYYSNRFISSGMGKDAWMDRKEYLKKKYDYINVEIDDLRVDLLRDRIRVSFSQNYKSSGYSAIGDKTLVLVNEGKEWKIIQEIWKKS